MTPIHAFAHDPSDTDRVRRQKDAIFVVASSCCLAGCVWTAMYAVVFGWGLTTALPASFVLIVGSALAWSHFSRDHTVAVYAQISCILFITTGIQWSIGGAFDSGFVMAWAFCGPITALVFFSLRQSLVWLGLYLVAVAVTVAFEDVFAGRAPPVDPTIRTVFFVMNLSVSSLVVFTFAAYFMTSATSQRARADALQASLDEARRLGPYTLERKLGAGGMGEVYLARHALLRRKTAIKLLKGEANGPGDLARFEREVQLTSEINHPNVVAVYDFGRSEAGEFYYAMEHLPGVDLQTLVDAEGPLSSARAVPILRQIADALDAAHAQGLIHRDVKPANVIISRFGVRTDVVRVLDFGLVKEVQEHTALTADNVICGTPAYLAPEALIRPDAVGPACDVYALGAVAFFLLTGRPVFSGQTVAEVVGHHIHTAPIGPAELAEQELPAALDALVLSCLHKEPAQRPDAAGVRGSLARTDTDARWTPARAAAWWDRFEAHRADRLAHGGSPGDAVASGATVEIARRRSGASAQPPRAGSWP